MYKRWLSILWGLWTVYSVHAGVDMPNVLVQNYTANDYKAASQNWDVSISPDGILFVANGEGLLTFDGNTWNLYPLPDDSLITDLCFEDGLIYSRGENSMGYWQENEMGIMEYYPLDELPASVNFEPPATDYPVPPEILPYKPTTFATAGNLNFTGTETNGLFISDDEGNILLHLNQENKLQDNTVRIVEVQDEHLVWVALDNGLCQIDIDPPIVILGKRSKIGKLEEAVLQDKYLYIQTSKGFFKQSVYSIDSFTPIEEEEASLVLYRKDREEFSLTDSLYTLDLGVFSGAEKIYYASDNLYWVTRENEAGLFQIDEKNAILKCRIMFDNYGLNLETRGKQFFSLNDSICLVSAVQGTLLVNIRQLIEGELRNPTPPRFSRIAYSDSEGVHNMSPTISRMVLPNKFRELVVHIGTTIFTPNHQVSYKIEGVAPEWSPWQRSGRISFFQLPEGKYQIHIRKYVVRGPFPEITLTVEVRPPWYNTIWAYIVYILFLWLLIREGLRFQLKSLKKEEQERGEAQLLTEQKRTQELKNEILEAELQNKNNELLLQTSALVKRNEAIQGFMDELDRQKETLGDRYPNKLYNRMRQLMEDAKSDQADWSAFEAYFNGAHRDFIERLGKQYNDITPGDLRVCCLLRMNLSTKEIASLMNVSIRAIELRRYRLRKRLDLDSDTNLVDFLINF